MFDWLGETIEVIEQMKRFDEEESTRLTINSDQDIPESFEDIKSVLISHKYDGNQVGDVIENLLEKAPFIQKLTIMPPVKWSDICSMDWGCIEDLKVSLEGEITTESLIIKKLKRLTLFGEKGISHGACLDISNIKSLESLSIHRIRDFDAIGISPLSGLKELDLQDIGLSSLEWLWEAKYQLQKLCIIDSIFDCSGLETQSNLTRLTIRPCVMMDVTPIENLHFLKHLDLSTGSILSEGNLREMGIDELLLNRHDADLCKVKTDAMWITHWVAMSIRAQDNNYRNQDYLEKLNPFRKKSVLRTLELPLEQRIIESIEHQYKRHLQMIKEYKYQRLQTLTNNEYLQLFERESKKIYPFL